MKDITVVEDRISFLKSQLCMLDKIREDELHKPIMERRGRYLLFINRELSAYRFAITELEWVVEAQIPIYV
jgi:hypothetical protein